MLKLIENWTCPSLMKCYRLRDLAVTGSNYASQASPLLYHLLYHSTDKVVDISTSLIVYGSRKTHRRQVISDQAY